MKTLKTVLCIGASVFSAGCLATAAHANDGASDTDEAAASANEPTQLGEIVVTAQKRSENIQKVPVAVTAFSGQALAVQAVTSVTDLGPITPGLKIEPGNGVLLPFLRGVGSTLTALGNEPSVGVYVDGVYYTRLLPGLFSLNNVERVEVLKGPQGTLFGRNSTGGLIQVITPLPSETLQARGGLGYGNYNTLTGDMYISGGLGDGVALDLTVSGQRQGDGFGKNIALDRRVNFQDDFTARSKLLIEPSDRTRIVLSGFYTYIKNSAASSTYPGTIAGYSSAPYGAQPTLGFYDENTDVDNYVKAEQYGGALTVSHELNFASVKSISAYSRNVEFGSFDLEKSPRADGAADLYTGLKQFTQELQLSSLPGGALTWIVGAFYYNGVSSYDPAFLYGPLQSPGDVIGDNVDNGLSIRSKQKAESISIFGHATYELMPSLKLTGGVRYTHDTMSAHGTVGLVSNNVETVLLTRDPRFSKGKITYKVALDYQFSNDILGYASYISGYKSGGFNLLPVSNTPVRPETIKAYEVGLKTELLDRRVRLNLAAFWYDIGSPQVQLLQAASVLTANAGSSRVKGVEADGSIAAAPGLTINFAASYLDSKYRNFPQAPYSQPVLVPPYGATNPLGSVDAAGNHTPAASKFTGSIGAAYKFSSAVGEWALSADYAYNDGYYFEPSNLFRQKAYSMVNAAVTVHPTSHISLGAWVKNLTDARYVTHQSTQAGPSGFTYTPGSPRRYGVRLGFEF